VTLTEHFAAARPPRGQESCGCCKGSGEHVPEGHECYRCDASGTVRRGSKEPYCDDQRQPRRRHWRQAARHELMSVEDLLGLHSDEALRLWRRRWGDSRLGHGTGTTVRDIYDRKAAEMARNEPAWSRLDEPIRTGTIDPVLLEKSGSGHTVVNEGGHRIVRAHQLGVSHLPVSWDPGSQLHRYDWEDPEPLPHEGKLAGVGDYGMGHRPLRDGAPAHDLHEGYSEDIYTHPQYWASSWPSRPDAEGLAQLRRVRGKPDDLVTIYRGVPEGTERRFHTGEWVSLSRTYAHNHAYNEGEADERAGHPWVVHKAQVPARHVRDAGTAQYTEQGYWGPDIDAEQDEPGHHTALLADHPEYGPEPEYHFAPEDWPQEERFAHNDREFDKRRQWKQHIQRGLSLGHITHDETKQLGYYPSGHAHRDEWTGKGGWQPLPQRMYHVTTDLESVRQHGLKTRDELNQMHGHGLGGGESDTISLTTNHGLAGHILGALHEMHRAVNGKITPQQMWNQARRGYRAQRPYHESIARNWHSDWKEGDELPMGLREGLRGYEVKQGGMLGSPEEIRERHGPGWEPADEGIDVPKGRMHYTWRRKMDPDKQREFAAEVYKRYSNGRWHAGGPEDPMFFLSDTKAFAKKDPKNFALLHVRPRPGAQGYPVSGMNEWRTGTGDALDVHHYAHQPSGELHEAILVVAGITPDDEFVHQGPSPLDYRESSALHPDRLAIVNSAAGEHPKGDAYFAETSRKVFRNPDTGRRLKNPRTIVTPGAEPGTVAFVDYTRPTPDSVYVNYMKTRSDRRGEGLGTALAENLIARHPDAKIIHFGKMMHPAMGHIKEEMARRYPDRTILGHVRYASLQHEAARSTITAYAWSPASIHLAAGEAWFHGSDRPEEFDRFDLSRHRAAHEEGEPDENDTKQRWWNSRLGSHFSSMHHVASNFAELNGDGWVYHADLSVKNPAHYRSEYDLDRHGFTWARQHGYRFDPLHEAASDDPDRQADHAGALREHPQSQEIADGFRRHLQERGHDGITYGNEYEEPHLHLCAIAFHPDQVHIGESHRVYAHCDQTQSCEHCGNQGVEKSDPYCGSCERLNQHVAAVFIPTKRIFGPTTCLDKDLFDGDHLKPQVRSTLLARLDSVLAPVLGSGWEDVASVHLAGSQVSMWTDENCQGNGDLDTLIGIAYTHARNRIPAWAVLTDEAIDKLLNAALREHYNASHWHPAFAPGDREFDLTGYVNSGAIDIRSLNPYAAYDLIHDDWTVRPPQLPSWGPESFPQGPALFQEARGLIAQVRAILRLPEPFRAQEARRIWAYIHEGRKADFSETGMGWLGVGNVLEKALDQASGDLVGKLKAAVYGQETGPQALGHGETTATILSASPR